MPNKIPELADIAQMNKAELAAFWEQVFGLPPTFTSSKEFLQHIIAGKLQGGVPSSLKRKLDKLKPTNQTRCAGTVIIKEWRKRKYHITVMDDGFVYHGKPYASLTKIAKEITGTAWNGPRFFGLRK